MVENPSILDVKQAVEAAGSDECRVAGEAEAAALREASRAAREAIPWLCKAPEVAVLAAPSATPRTFEPQRLVDYLAARGVKVRLERLAGSGEAGPMLLEGARAVGAGMLVAGAFGHPRFQQFIFGGATRTLMQAEGAPSLFLSH